MSFTVFYFSVFQCVFRNGRSKIHPWKCQNPKGHSEEPGICIMKTLKSLLNCNWFMACSPPARLPKFLPRATAPRSRSRPRREWSPPGKNFLEKENILVPLFLFSNLVFWKEKRQRQKEFKRQRQKSKRSKVVFNKKRITIIMMDPNGRKKNSWFLVEKLMKSHYHPQIFVVFCKVLTSHHLLRLHWTSQVVSGVVHEWP